MLVNVDFDVVLDIDFDVGLSDTRGCARLTHTMLIPQTSILRSAILMTWRSRAACLKENPELFFPTGNSDPAFHQIDKAKAVCRRCPVVDTCLRWAMASAQDAGVWGGLSDYERRALKRRNARTGRRGPATPLR
jgi:WhiB family redox-sensing transcriptional regulator